MILCAAPVEVYDHGVMSSDLPAVVPLRLPEPGSAADLLPQPTEPAEQGLPALWPVWATPVLPAAAHGATRALVASWALPPDVPDTLRDVASVAVHAAAAVAKDQALPAEVRITAVREGREILQTVAAASEQRAERRAGLIVCVGQVVGLIALGGLLARLVDARR